MSNIKIVCRKGCLKETTEHGTNKNETGNELVIKASQVFLDTKEFYKTVEASVKGYFDTIKKE